MGELDDEFPARLRAEVAELEAVGLTPDEALLIATKRVGAAPQAAEAPDRTWIEALLFAAGAAVAIQFGRLAPGSDADVDLWFVRNLSFFVLPFLAAYFARRRRLTGRQWLVAAIPFVVSAVVVNLFPFRDESTTELLLAAHLPVALWFAVAYPYTGGALRSHERRMEFVRFTGEWFIHYVLIAMGGGVLVGLTTAILEPAGIDVESLIPWVLPSGAVGAVIVAAWLVESKPRVVENMAPVLAMVFTPLFAGMVTVATLVYAFTGLGAAFDRELLGIFDGLLVVVLGLVVFGMSARASSARPGWSDRIQLVAIVGALLLDLMVLGAMVVRIGDLGFTPNRAAALGLNLVLLVNLAGAAWLSGEFLAGRRSFDRLERWQTAYLPVYPAWAATVVLAFPLLFSFS